MAAAAAGGADSSLGLCARLSCLDSFCQNGGFMGTPFSPTRLDVERYRSMRALCVEMNHRIVKMIPRKAYEQIGDAIGIRHNGVLVFDNEHVSSVLMDCCVRDWYENGKNMVQRYSEAHPAKPGTDESYILTVSYTHLTLPTIYSV